MTASACFVFYLMRARVRVCVCPRSYLDVLQVDVDQADLVGLGQQLDARDAAELCEGGQDAQLVVDHLTHAIARSHQQGHHRLPVLELKGVRKDGERDEKKKKRGSPHSVGSLPSWWH